MRKIRFGCVEQNGIEHFERTDNLFDVCFFMDIHGVLSISMNTHAYPWIAMDIYGYPGIPKDIHGYSWLSLGTRNVGAGNSIVIQIRGLLWSARSIFFVCWAKPQLSHE